MIKIKDDHEMISTCFQKNLKLLEKAKEATKEEHELILLIIIYELRQMTNEIIENWNIADS
ncbi:uncharacterized protein METZ01_LOCUS394096 [marine metagenome]|uniref:Uncharacterized protein n=1 Tax=marine metagenome TaxID=408172 RepID=A0A382V425_9ZZZZ